MRVHTVAALILTAPALAGPLNPPAGPVSPTQKPLAEIEPRIAINDTNTPGDGNSVFRITQPVSYYLTANVTGAAVRHGIEIAASNVTVDLNGFTVQGVSSSLDGITADGMLTGIVIRNGIVRGWTGDGIDLSPTGVTGGQVSDVVSANNGGVGIRVGRAFVVSGCTVSSNNAEGLVVGGGNQVSACVAFANGSDGIEVPASGCVISRSTAYANGGFGIYVVRASTIVECASYNNEFSGIFAVDDCVVTRCAAGENNQNGIVVSSGCQVVGNACSLNAFSGDGAGILVLGPDNRIEDNNCKGSTRGIDVEIAGSIIVRNTCSGNTTNWDIMPNNVVGPIIDRTAPASAAILGNSGPDSTGSTHPNANFSY